ncbi:MAG: PKD domain-containing protein [Bacteroidia bacterium]
MNTLFIFQKKLALSLGIIFSLFLMNNVSAQCTASFNYTINSNGNVSFLSTSTPTSNYNHSWSFGNSQTATTTAANTTYTANGTYTVNLFIWNTPTTCSAVATQTILITNATNTCNLQAGFTYSIAPNGVVSFFNTTANSSSLTTYHWSQNNNYFSSQTNPTYTFSNGYYIVCLTAVDSLNMCTDTKCDSILINNSNCNINANFTYSLGANGNATFFSTSTGTSSSTNYSWWFGNNQSANTPTASVNYTFNNWYTVCLFVSDSSNTCWSNYCDTIQITNASNSSTCNANFTYSIGANGNVTFSSTSTGTTSNTNYFWSFNNNMSIGGPNTSATFTNYFNYVCLTIYDSTSFCFSTHCDSIIIPSNPCNANVNFVMLQDTSQNLTWWAVANYPSNVTNAVWHWGDNSSSTGLFPSHTYSASGFYNICVSITVACSSTGSFCTNTFINKSAEAPLPVYHVNVVGSALTTGVNKHSETSSIDNVILFPNPAKSYTTLKLNSGKVSELSIFIHDITGRQLSTQKTDILAGDNEITIKTGDLSKGMYFITISDNASKKTMRLIKN